MLVPLLLSEVHYQFFSFAHVQQEMVLSVLQVEDLSPGGLIIVGYQSYNGSVIRKLYGDVGACSCLAVVGLEQVQQGAKNTALGGSVVEDEER